MSLDAIEDVFEAGSGGDAKKVVIAIEGHGCIINHQELDIRIVERVGFYVHVRALSNGVDFWTFDFSVAP